MLAVHEFGKSPLFSRNFWICEGAACVMTTNSAHIFSLFSIIVFIVSEQNYKVNQLFGILWKLKKLSLCRIQRL